METEREMAESVTGHLLGRRRNQTIAQSVSLWDWCKTVIDIKRSEFWAGAETVIEGKMSEFGVGAEPIIQRKMSEIWAGAVGSRRACVPSDTVCTDWWQVIDENTRS